MSSQSVLPHAFNPSVTAVERTLCAHPGGATELFMLAVNMEIDMKLDARHAKSTGYKAIQVRPNHIKQEAKQQHPFSVPLQLNYLALTPSPPPASSPAPAAVKMEF
jgi:hypothetical protein